MANATATENCILDQCCDDLNVDELSNIDSLLLMSLLEDSQVEDEDEEMLRIMIQSLEPEILNQDSCSGTYSSVGCPEDYQFSDVDQLESCCSTSPDHHLDFEWTDMETAYSCPSDDMTSFLTGHFTEKIETMVELGGIGDYSQVYHGMPMVMEEDDDYIGLWQ